MLAKCENWFVIGIAAVILASALLVAGFSTFLFYWSLVRFQFLDFGLSILGLAASVVICYAVSIWGRS